MGDDFETELAEKVGKGKVDPEVGEEIARTMVGFTGPKDGDWETPELPEQDGMTVVAEERKHKQYASAEKLLYLPPFPLLCRTDGMGLGPAKASPLTGQDNGSFDIAIAAGPWQYSFALASPCNHFRAPRDGWIKLSFKLVVWGQGLVTIKEGGKAELEIGVFGAHCHPKEEGKYWQEPGITIKTSGRERYENRELTFDSFFPVKKDTEYSFGTGVTARAFSWGLASAGLRLWGKQAYTLIEMVKRPPAKLPW